MTRSALPQDGNAIEDQPEAHTAPAYGTSPAMLALPCIKAFNALPIGSPQRSQAVRDAWHEMQREIEQAAE